MPYRTVPLVTGKYYHVFNRGVEKRNIFTKTRDYRRFLETFVYYQQHHNPQIRFSLVSEIAKLKEKPVDQTVKLVEILVFCLMPNHFHFLLLQDKDGGISTFIRRLANSYTRYFNTKHDRIGPLFQGQFKAVRIETDEQFIHVSRYIHLNPVVNYLVKNPIYYPWSSYSEYLEKPGSAICLKEKILNFFPKPGQYQKFVLDQVDYVKRLESIKHLTIDQDYTPDVFY